MTTVTDNPLYYKGEPTWLAFIVNRGFKVARKVNSSWSEAEMIRAYTEVLHDLRVNWGVTTRLTVSTGSIRYVLSFELAAYDDSHPEDPRPVARCRWEYPNVKPSELVAQMFQQSVTLARMVEEYRRPPEDLLRPR